MNSFIPVSGHFRSTPNLLNVAPKVLIFCFLARVRAQLAFRIQMISHNFVLFPANEKKFVRPWIFEL